MRRRDRKALQRGLETSRDSGHVQPQRHGQTPQRPVIVHVTITRRRDAPIPARHEQSFSNSEMLG